MSETGVQIVFCTFPDAEVARQIGTTLVRQQLARCVNLIPAVESIYEWEGKIERAAEVLAVFKIAAVDYGDFERSLTGLHPYDVPEVLVAEIEAGGQTYLDWVLRR